MAAKAENKVKKREKFTEIYSDYFPVIFSSVYTKVGNYEDAMDIAQEVFVIFYNKFDEVENPRRWLYGTLRNVVLQYYKKKPDPTVNIDTIFDDIGLTFVNGFRDNRIIIEEAIENVELIEEERLILDYVAFHTFSYREVGEIMGYSKDQISYKYTNIVKKIKNYLQTRGIRDIEDLL